MGLTDLHSSAGSQQQQQPHNGRKSSHDQPRRDYQSQVAQLSEGDSSNNDVDKPVSCDSKQSSPQTGSGRIQQSILQEKWQFMFERLLSFKERHGHCLVPNRYRDRHVLGAWVSTQRRQVSS